MYLGFVFIRYGNTHGHRNDCHEGRGLYSQISKDRSHVMSQRATWGRSRVGQEAEGQGESMTKAFIVVFTAKKG